MGFCCCFCLCFLQVSDCSLCRIVSFQANWASEDPRVGDRYDSAEDDDDEEAEEEAWGSQRGFEPQPLWDSDSDEEDIPECSNPPPRFIESEPDKKGTGRGHRAQLEAGRSKLREDVVTMYQGCRDQLGELTPCKYIPNLLLIHCADLT